MTEVVSCDNWSYKSCKAPVKSSPATNQHPAFYRPDILPVAQPTALEQEHWMEIYAFVLYVQSLYRPRWVREIINSIGKGVTRIFHWGGGKIEGREREWGCWEGTATSHQLEGLGERCELPQLDSGWNPDRPKVFHYCQHSGWPLLTL